MMRREFLAMAVAGRPDGGARYLWGKQARDGGWHSQTYGLLRSGESLTPFVLEALLAVPEEAPRGAVEAALEFLRRQRDSEGALGRASAASFDYPVYASAYGVLAWARWGGRGWESEALPLARWIEAQQLAGGNGWTVESPCYGGWGMGPANRPPYSGHVDLSMTRMALQALSRAGLGAGFAAARTFLARLQDMSTDGGFCFSPVVLDANKAGERDGRYVSYATATADGLLALQAAEGEASRIGQARAWLEERGTPEEAPGFDRAIYSRYRAGLRFYWASCAREALGRRVKLAAPRADGSWANPEPLVKEDDPLIATAFAVRALAA